MFDTHSHLNFNVFKEDAEVIIKDCLNKGINIINIGSQYSTSKRAVEIASGYEKGVYAAIGLHPIHLMQLDVDEEEIHFRTREERFFPEKYRRLISDKTAAIGEIGLDYFHIPSEGRGEKQNFISLQKSAFDDQMQFAGEVNLPVILHCRGSKDDPLGAYLEMLDIMRKYEKNIRGVIHCFGANWEIAEKFLDLGFYIGFTGIITFKKAPLSLLEAVKRIPLERILSETDCPYLSPEPHRGERCIPQYVEFTLRKIAEIKNMDFEKIEKQVDENAGNLFRGVA